MGIVFAVLACGALAVMSSSKADRTTTVTAALYGMGLFAMLGCSAAYNLAPAGGGKLWLRKLDHAVIFVMIAGTYSPVALLAIGGPLGSGILVFVWCGALIGAGIKLFAADRFERGAIAAYLVLGWAGIVAVGPLARTLPTLDLALLGGGAALYSIGVFAHVSTRLPYQNAIWHGFVLAAAASHYALVFRLCSR